MAEVWAVDFPSSLTLAVHARGHSPVAMSGQRTAAEDTEVKTSPYVFQWTANYQLTARETKPCRLENYIAFGNSQSSPFFLSTVRF